MSRKKEQQNEKKKKKIEREKNIARFSQHQCKLACMPS